MPDQDESAAYQTAIWRRLVVSADATLTQLHNVLQIAMGWENSHLHEFRVDSQRQARLSTSPLRSNMRVGEVLTEIGGSLTYMYDFGDGWEHKIVVEKHLPEASHADYPVCLEGQLACPPEDCGGVPGYYDLLDVLKHPDDEQYEEMREWIGDDFDPQAFSADAVNRQLTRRRVRHGTST